MNNKNIINTNKSDTINSHIISNSNVHGVTGNVVGTSGTQTLTNKTLTNPTISTINNGGTLTLPTGPATLATLDDLPSTADFVDLTSIQTVTGSKTFNNTLTADKILVNLSSPPGLQVQSANNLFQIGQRFLYTGSPNVEFRLYTTGNSGGKSEIGNTTSHPINIFTNSINRVTISDTVTNILNTLQVSTLQTNTINDTTNTNNVSINGAQATNLSNPQTLSNKNISSSTNNISITSGALVNQNINSVINQELLTSSSPTFNLLTAARITESNFSAISKFNGIINVSPTPISAAGVFVNLFSATTPTTLITNNFTSPTTSSPITYTGVNSRWFQITYNVSCINDDGVSSFTVGTRLTLNGTAISGTTSYNHIHGLIGGTDAYSYNSNSRILQLNNNDVIQIQVANLNNANDVLVSWWTFSLIELPYQ